MTHPIVEKLYANMTLPVIGAPMFIVANPKLILAQCTHGIIGSMPALNARTTEQLDEQLAEITAGLKTSVSPKTAPYAINQIVHASNTRLEKDMVLCEKYQTPILITSLSAPADIAKAAHAWGGIVFHDVISVRHAEKALEAGVDGLILVCNGAGGHAGTINPFALVSEIRRFYNGPIALSGAISTGAGILGARAAGADFAYMGTRFIATTEANASDEYKNMLLQASAKDIIYTPYFTGVSGNYLVQSIINAGINPEELNKADKTKMNFGENVHGAKAWKDIWGAGQGVGTIDKIMSTAELITQLQAEYKAARDALFHSL